MKLTRKGDSHGDNEKHAGHVHMPWEAALAGLASGAYDLAGYPKESRGPDQPGAQSPAPGTDPADGTKENAAPGDVLTNISRSSASGLEPDEVPTQAKAVSIKSEPAATPTAPAPAAPPSQAAPNPSAPQK